MSTIRLAPMPQIVSGRGALASIGEETRALLGTAGTVLLVADKGLHPVGHIEAAIRHLEGAGHHLVLFDEISGEPAESDVEKALSLCGDRPVDAVVCLGGGSALDVGKLVAAIASDGRPVGAFRLAKSDLPVRQCALLAVPTTSGTGSEVTSTSVLKSVDGSKVWYWGDALKPDMVILDPELTISLPPRLTAATGLDAWVHAVESATNRNANLANSTFALRSLALINEYLPVAVENPSDLVARSNLQLAATFAGIAIDNSGTAIAHAIGHALGGLVQIPHGEAVAVSMMATLPFTIEGNRVGFGEVAAAMELGSVDDLPDAFVGLCDRAGLYPISSDVRDLSVEALAKKIGSPENEPMVRATARDIGRDDLTVLASETLEAIGQARAA